MSPFRFAERLHALEAHLIDALALTPLPLPAALCAARGHWKGAEVSLEARAYRSKRVGYARFVTLRGEGLEIGNVLCASTPQYPLPLLGIDLVGRGGPGEERGVVVADLSPTVPEGPLRERQAAVLEAQLRLLPALPREPLPAWSLPLFSPLAFLARGGPGDVEQAAEVLAAYPRAYIELARTCRPLPALSAEVGAAQRAYARVHREEDRGLSLLARIFPPDLASRLLGELLFPEGCAP